MVARLPVKKKVGGSNPPGGAQIRYYNQIILYPINPSWIENTLLMKISITAHFVIDDQLCTLYLAVRK